MKEFRFYTKENCNSNWVLGGECEGTHFNVEEHKERGKTITVYNENNIVTTFDYILSLEKYKFVEVKNNEEVIIPELFHDCCKQS